MKKAEITKNLSGTINKISFKLKKHSPEILIVAGVVGTVVSTVMACKATTKAGDILDEAKEDINKVHECSSNEDLIEEYTPEDTKKDLTLIYVQTGIKFAKLYAPSVALGVISLGSIIASNNILRKRNVALAAAYATVDKGFKKYRDRVVERFGNEVDHELRHNIKAKKIDKIIVDDKGKEKKVKEEVQVVDSILDEYSDFARFFDDGCTGWEKDSEYNLMFLRAQQQYANDLLVANGRLFLNDVYEMLGIPKTKAGQVVGWVYNPGDKDHMGDNYVDFGIYDVHKQKNRDFVNGYERTILLDFNVDGNVWETM